MQTLSGHFDGKVVILDEQASFPPNTRVMVIAPGPRDSDSALTASFAQAAEPVFETIWDNPLDADYDRL